MADALLPGGARWAEPVLGDAVEVGTALSPRARGRDSDERRPQADPTPHGRVAAEELDQLLATSRALGEDRSGAPVGLHQLITLVGLLGRPQEPLGEGLAHGQCERPVVASRDQMDRRAHQRALDDRALTEGPVEVGATEPREAGPEANVRRRCVLSLDPRHALEGSRDRQLRPLEEELPGEERTVQLELGEDPRHRPSVERPG